MFLQVAQFRLGQFSILHLSERQLDRLIAVPLDSATAGAVGVGSPVRWFEPVEIRIYLSSGSDWIGQRQVATGEVIQPLAGPLVRGGSFDYLTRGGLPAGTPAVVGAVGYAIAAPGAAVPARTSGFVLLKGQ